MQNITSSVDASVLKYATKYFAYSLHKFSTAYEDIY